MDDLHLVSESLLESSATEAGCIARKCLCDQRGIRNSSQDAILVSLARSVLCTHWWFLVQESSMAWHGLTEGGQVQLAPGAARPHAAI